MKKIFLGLIVLFLAGCGTTASTPASVGSIYLPVATGNSWAYRDGTNNWTVDVQDAFLLQGVTVYRFSQIYPFPVNGEIPFPHPYFYFSDRAFRITSQPSLTDLSFFVDLFRLPLVLGDNYQNTIGRWTVESLTDTVTVAAGTFHDCARIKIAPNVNPDTDTHYFYLAPHVGLVKSFNPVQVHTIELVSYTVH